MTRFESKASLPIVSRERALEIAREDASSVYHDLPAYDVTGELEDGNWVIAYRLRDKLSQGGGPHYLISGQTGEILAKRYEQ